MLAEAVAAGTTVVNVSQCLNGEVQQGAYATGAALDAAGVLPGLDLTPEAAFAKLHLLLARGLPAPALRRAMSEPIRGECSPG